VSEKNMRKSLKSQKEKKTQKLSVKLMRPLGSFEKVLSLSSAGVGCSKETTIGEKVRGTTINKINGKKKKKKKKIK